MEEKNYRNFLKWSKENDQFVVEMCWEYDGCCKRSIDEYVHGITCTHLAQGITIAIGLAYSVQIARIEIHLQNRAIGRQRKRRVHTLYEQIYRAVMN